MVLPDFQPVRVSEEPVCIDIFRQNPVFNSLHLRSPVHVGPPQRTAKSTGDVFTGWGGGGRGKASPSRFDIVTIYALFYINNLQINNEYMLLFVFDM